MIKWRKMWFRVVYVGLSLMTLAIAAGAGHVWD